MYLGTARRGRSADYELQIHAVEILYLEMGKLIRGSSCVSIPDFQSLIGIHTDWITYPLSTVPHSRTWMEVFAATPIGVRSFLPQIEARKIPTAKRTVSLTRNENRYNNRQGMKISLLCL